MLGKHERAVRELHEGFASAPTRDMVRTHMSTQEHYELGDIVARRTLYFLSEDGVRHDVVVELGRPQPFPDPKDYFCPYRIVGLGPERLGRAGGVDAFQALQLALRSIAVELEVRDPGGSQRLQWEAGSVPGDLGFPGT